MALIGASIFFLLERNRVDGRWHTTMTLLGVTMLISAIFYYYVQGMWVDTGKAPIVLRYLDWILTHSMQVVLFYVILTAVTKVSSALFWRLLIGTLVMVIGEFLGTAAAVPKNSPITITKVPINSLQNSADETLVTAVKMT